jgi:hypothetical protein
MRYMTGHGLVQSVVGELGIETRPFDIAHAPERLFLRGVVGNGPDDPAAGAAYDLPASERGRSAGDLMTSAFLRIVPEARELDADGWRRVRATATFGDRRLTDWSIGDAVATILTPNGHRFATDAFGYDSGIRPHNAGDAIQYLMGTGYPSGAARVPVDGMDRIPRELAARFEAAGGSVRLGYDVRRIEVDDGHVVLSFADGSGVRARALVLAVPLPALEALAGASPVIDGSTWRQLFSSVAGYPATKLYCWYEWAWWREGADAPTGLRTTTDLPNRMVFYFDEGPDRPAAMLAAFADTRHSEPIVALADGRSRGEPATGELLAAVSEWLRATHPGAVVPRPVGSAFQHWGADPREVAWHFWRAGSNSDQNIELAAQPDASLPIHLCGEVFARHGAWVEGALETADALVGRLSAPSAEP